MMDWLRFRVWSLRATLRHRWHEDLPRWVAMRLPHKVVLFTFIRVFAASGYEPYDVFYYVYDAWENGAGR